MSIYTNLLPTFRGGGFRPEGLGEARLRGGCVRRLAGTRGCLHRDKNDRQPHLGWLTTQPASLAHRGTRALGFCNKCPAYAAACFPGRRKLLMTPLVPRASPKAASSCDAAFQTDDQARTAGGARHLRVERVLAGMRCLNPRGEAFEAVGLWGGTRTSPRGPRRPAREASMRRRLPKTTTKRGRPVALLRVEVGASFENAKCLNRGGGFRGGGLAGGRAPRPCEGRRFARRFHRSRPKLRAALGL